MGTRWRVLNSPHAGGESDRRADRQREKTNKTNEKEGQTVLEQLPTCLSLGCVRYIFRLRKEEEDEGEGERERRK